MKILLIRSSSGYVDVRNAHYNIQETGLAKAFNRRGHQCDVVFWGGKKEEVIEIEYDEGKTFKVFYLKAYDFLKNGIYKGLKELSKKYDIVHCGGYDQLESWLLAKSIPEKLVVYHGTYYSDFNKGYNKKCKVIDKVVLPRYKKRGIFFDTKSDLSTDFLKERGLEDVYTVGVGIDLERLQAREMLESPLSDKIKSLKNDNKKILMYVGRIEPRRNIIFLLDVFKSVYKEDNNTKLLIVGRGEKEYKDKCFEHAREIGIEDAIMYEEYIDQKYLPLVYSYADVFLLPTIYEIFGMVMLEAMYFGAPVITTYNGGSDMLIDNNENGIIIDNFNVGEWKESIIGLLNDSEKKDRIVKNAKIKIENEFTWDALVDKFIGVYEKRLGCK
ncbi:MAG: glycosyltransferase family 4 protein [Eubacterium sp.]|nr:glycosyltransferase family 4 protein [Eubacterium sp.]